MDLDPSKLKDEFKDELESENDVVIPDNENLGALDDDGDNLGGLDNDDDGKQPL